MKKINLYITTLVLSGIMLIAGGCSDFLDVNTSKNNPIDPPIPQRMPLVVFMASQITYDHAEYGAYLSQCLTTGGRSATNEYAYKSGWWFTNMNRHPQWRRHYYDIGVNADGLMTRAEKENARNVTLITRTILLYSTLLTTDAFGDIPRTEVYQSSAPSYDTQESIYEWMTAEVDELIKLYADESWTKNPDNVTITPEMDRIFQGNLAKWAVFAKAIKARMLLRKLPNWDNTPAACDQIIAAVDAALNDPNYTDIIYKYSGGVTEQNSPWGPAQPKLNLGWAQARENLLTSALPSKFFLYGMLGGYSRESAYVPTRRWALDPRAEKMMNPVAGKPMYYLDNNIGMATSEKITDYPGLYGQYNPFTKNDGYILLIGREELLFIKAEAQYWKGDKVGSYATYREAVTVSLQRYDAIPADNAAAAVKNAYTRFLNIRFPGEADYTIAELMQQKYIAMYLQPEQWTDVRRYNYSSRTNGIRYDGEYIYSIKHCHSGGTTQQPTIANFGVEFSLTRPYNLYAPHWDTPDDYGVAAKFSPNAWVNRINYDPETEDKYNRKELERLGAFKNPDWLRKRMIWAYKNNNYVECSDANIEWK